MNLRSLILPLGESILKEAERVTFRNERKSFSELINMIIRDFPDATSPDGTLREPYRSLAFLVTIGQRPASSLLILKLLMRNRGRLVNGKKIGEMLAKELRIPSRLTTRGGNYKDRIGDLVAAFVKIGILESVSSGKPSTSEEGFRIKQSSAEEVTSFIDYIESRGGLLHRLEPLRLEELFSARFDKKVKYVIKSGTDQRQQFRIGKIIKSLLNPKLSISFETALRVVDEIESKLKKEMTTLEIQSLLSEALAKYDRRAAEIYRTTYPKVLSMTMSDGSAKVVNYELVRALINKEVKLKLTSSVLDRFASTVYNVITRNPKKYESEAVIREYVDALVHSEFFLVRSESSFIESHLEIAISTLEGCRDSLQSGEVNPARTLFGQFLEHICLVALTLFGYLPSRNPEENVDFISNLLKQESMKKEIEEGLQLDKDDLFRYQRIRFMMQIKNTASMKSLEKMIEEGEKIIEVSRNAAAKLDLGVVQKRLTSEMRQATVRSQVSTGNSDLDDLLLGGIPENYAVILTSPSCDEREMLINKFLEAGVSDGQTTFHVTMDASGVKAIAEKHWQNFHLFICNPEAEPTIENLTNVFILRGVQNLTEISIALNSALQKLDRSFAKPRRACIEIISDVMLQHHSLSTRRWLASLIPTFKSRGFTTLAVMNPHMHSTQEVHAVLDLFDGEINIYTKQTERGLKRFLRVEKMYEQEYLETELSLKRERTMSKKRGERPENGTFSLKSEE